MYSISTESTRKRKHQPKSWSDRATGFSSKPLESVSLPQRGSKLSSNMNTGLFVICIIISGLIVLFILTLLQQFLYINDFSTVEFVEYDSFDATVIGFGAGFDLKTYKTFVGSLRNTGFAGKIILGTQSDTQSNVISYLKSQNVTMKQFDLMNCTYASPQNYEWLTHVSPEEQLCVEPYSDVKIGWARFFLAHDWLTESKLTGPVLLSNVKNVFFQQNPFSAKRHTLKNVQFFEELHLTTKDWRVAIPLGMCKSFNWNVPLISASVIVGTYHLILDLLETLKIEMIEWTNTEGCHSNLKGDEIAILNYLFYDGKIKAEVITNRMGLLNSLSMEVNLTKKNPLGKGDMFSPKGTDFIKNLRKKKDDNILVDFWISSDYDLTDTEGYFLNIDGTRSWILNHINNWGEMFEESLMKKTFMKNDVGILDMFTHKEHFQSQELKDFSGEGYTAHNVRKMESSIKNVTNQIKTNLEQYYVYIHLEDSIKE